MLTHKGTQPIQTERLFLRRIRKKDWRDIYQYAVKEEVARYVSWTPHKSPKETKALCTMWAQQYQNQDYYHWAIVFGGRVIGNIEIVKLVGTTAIFGWQLDSLYWNQGIMTEAAGAVLKFLFREVGIDAAEAAHSQPNIGSGRVMQKIGMKETPFSQTQYYSIRPAVEMNGEAIVFYRVTREEWRHNIAGHA